jgi:type IV pilus assembly protein PilM
MQKILGLDIGSYSVKAVEILNMYKSYRVTGFHEVVIPEIEGVDAADVGMTAVRQLFRQNDLVADKIYTGVMGALASSRFFELENVKKRNIGAVVQSELESQAPFRVEDVVIDHQLLETQGAISTVLAVMARKEDIESYLNELQDISIEPKVIDVDYLSFMNLIPFFRFEDDELAGQRSDSEAGRKEASVSRRRYRLLIDVGHQKTSVVLFRGQRLVAARTIRMAGRYFTEFLQKNLNVTYGEAQRIKHGVSRIEVSENARPGPSGDKEFLVARLIGVSVVELVKEISRTVHSFTTQEKEYPEAIYLSGGSAVISGLREHMEMVLGVPVKPFAFNTEKLSVDEDLSHRTTEMIQALSLGLRGVNHKRQSKINLRRGELALAGSYDRLVQQITNLGVVVASLLACLIAAYLLRVVTYGSEVTALKNDYRELVKKTLKKEPSDLSRIAAKGDFSLKDYSAKAIKLIEAEISESDAAVKYFSERQTVYPLRVLEDISKSLPKQVAGEGGDGKDGKDAKGAQSLIVDVLDFTVQGRSLSIDGETDSRASAEAIGSLLKNLSSLQGVNLTHAAKTGSDKIIKFRVQANLKEAQ